MSRDLLADFYSHQLPPAYRYLDAAGAFDPHSERHLQFTDLVWMNEIQALSYNFDKRQIPGLIPFAETLGGYTFCWYPPFKKDSTDQESPIVHCPDEDEVAIIFAPDFPSFLYRLFLEELCNSALIERVGQERAQMQLGEYLDIMRPYFQDNWIARADELLKRDWKEAVLLLNSCLDEEEYQDILEKDIPYERLDEEFDQLLPDEQTH